MNYSLREASLIISKPYKLLYDQMKRGELPKPTIKKGKRKVYSEAGLTELILKANPGRIVRTFAGESLASFTEATLNAETQMHDFVDETKRAFPLLGKEMRIEPLRSTGLPSSAGFTVNVTVAFDL